MCFLKTFPNILLLEFSFLSVRPSVHLSPLLHASYIVNVRCMSHLSFVPKGREGQVKRPKGLKLEVGLILAQIKKSHYLLQVVMWWMKKFKVLFLCSDMNRYRLFLFVRKTFDQMPFAFVMWRHQLLCIYAMPLSFIGQLHMMRLDYKGWSTIHSLIISRKGLILTLPFLPCREGRVFWSTPCRKNWWWENVRTVPKLGSFLEIHHLCPWDFPQPSRFRVSGNRLGVGDGFPNTSLVLMEHGPNEFLFSSQCKSWMRN